MVNYGYLSLKVSIGVFLWSVLKLVTELSNENSIGSWLKVLTTLLTVLAIIATYGQIKEDKVIYYSSILILEIILLLVFSSTNLLVFYTAFELSLIPLYVLLGIFGSSARLRASILLFLYTLSGSLILLLGIVLLIISSGTLNIEALTILSNENIDLVFVLLVISFIVKTPLVPFHIWLARAHAEANLAGSFLLAGIILKLATYGYIIIVLPLISSQISYYSDLVIVITLISLIYSSLNCIRITDVKALIAVSSVAHISIVVIGLFSNELEGLLGAFSLSIAHGLISPAAFLCVGGYLYSRFHTRQLAYYSGLSNLSPLFILVFFLTICANIGVPLSFNFVAELITLLGIFVISPLGGFFAASSIFLSAVYSLFIYNRISNGFYSINLGYAPDITRLEWNISFLLLVLTILFGLFPTPFLASISYQITYLL